MADAGIQLTERRAPVLDPDTFETNVPGLFIAGGAVAGMIAHTACSLPFDASGALIARQGWLALPGPAPLDLQRERPAEERANQHQASEQAQTEESQLMRPRLGKSLM